MGIRLSSPGFESGVRSMGRDTCQRSRLGPRLQLAPDGSTTSSLAGCHSVSHIQDTYVGETERDHALLRSVIPDKLLDIEARFNRRRLAFCTSDCSLVELPQVDCLLRPWSVGVADVALVQHLVQIESQHWMLAWVSNLKPTYSRIRPPEY
jgi:hypothetical protein